MTELSEADLLRALRELSSAGADGVELISIRYRATGLYAHDNVAYSQLQSLVEQGLVSAEWDGFKRLYRPLPQLAAPGPLSRPSALAA